MSKLDDAPGQILLKDLPSAEDEQFFMRRLSVYNWGTFSKIHTLRFADDGSLLLGPSGAGKSTLLDAISAMIVPPIKVHFNAAAEEGDRRGRDRTITSYVRGAWADKGDSESRDVVKQYLRPHGAISAIALEYGNRLGRTLTLVRLFWITGATASSNVNMHFVVAEGSFDLRELSDFDGDLRKLRKKLASIEGVRQHENFAAYQEHWCRIMGVEDVSALELLHKAQSTKSLGDLNTFLRQFMLEEPETFAKADALVAEFGELEEAHKAVVSAREQIEVLSPARNLYAEHGHISKEKERKGKLREATVAFVQQMRVGLIEQEIVRIQTDLEAAEGQHRSNEDREILLQDEIKELEARHLAAGGADIQAIESRLIQYKTQRESRSVAKQKAAVQCQSLGWTLADDAQSFAEQIALARTIDGGSTARDENHQQRRVDLAIQQHNLSNELKDLREEVIALEGSSSNIPMVLQRLRSEMCTVLRIPHSQAVFVGELVQVRKEFATEWAGATERLLGGFGKDLIIDERHHKSVAQWVDKTYLGLKLVYHPVKAGISSPRREPKTASSIVYKLEQKDHAFTGWVHGELLTRFDYECVSSAADLTRGDHRITAAGQIRHSRGRTEKDDRRDINDRRDWVLGFDSREKLELHRRLADAKAADLVDVTSQLKTLDSERQQELLRIKAAGRLLDFTWSEVDVASIADLIFEQEGKLKSLKLGNATLSDLDGQIVAARIAFRDLSDKQADLRKEIRDGLKGLSAHQGWLQTAKVEANALTDNHRNELLQRLSSDWSPTLRSLEQDVQKVSDQLHEEMMSHVSDLADRKQKIVSAFETLLRLWPEEGGSLQANLESAPDFFAKLKRLEEDGLPEHETRFRNLLSQQSTQRLAELSRHVQEGQREIALRLEDVNDALFTVNYNPDSYLKINPADLHLPEVAEFRERNRQIFADQRESTDDPVKAEQQFQLLRQLVMDLKAEDPEKKRWRDRVLDVRQHVEFNAEELERGTDKQLEFYSGSSGKSGGQRQKLTATCLASALRYKLGGVDGGVSTYAAVVLDEAFTKTDDAFTKTCMRVFKELGFQMIVATPIKSVMTLEEFVGGAVFAMIKNRNVSAVRQIEYQSEERRLALTAQDRRDAEDDDADD